MGVRQRPGNEEKAFVNHLEGGIQKRRVTGKLCKEEEDRSSHI